MNADGISAHRGASAGNATRPERNVLDDRRDARLAELLREHPGAVISAVDAFGRLVDLPASIQIVGHHVIQTGSPFELVEPASRGAIIEIWEQAKVEGTATAPVRLINGVDASCHIVDVRHRHGVLVGMITADAHVELATVLADRPAIVPRIGRTDKDEVGVICFADERIGRILGWDPADLIGRRSLDLIHPEDHLRAVDAWMDMLTSPGETTRLRARHLRGDGSWIWMEITNVNRLESAEGCVVTEMIDISDEMIALETLRQREQLLRRLAEALPSGILHIDRRRTVVYANARLLRVVGVDHADTVEEQLATVIPGDRPTLAAALDRALIDGCDTDIEVRLRMPDTSRQHLCSIAIRVLTDADDAPDGAVLCIDDVTEAAELRAELERRATVDELTGCLNRATVLFELDRVLRHHVADSPGTAVVFLDLDGFKVVNDTFGHRAGDDLLCSVVGRLDAVLRNGDMIGRLGGDEFIVVLPLIDDLEQAMSVGIRLGEAVSDPLEMVGGRPMRIRSSIGVAWACATDVSAAVLTAAADLAMYQSKRAGTSEPVCVLVERAAAVRGPA